MDDRMKSRRDRFVETAREPEADESGERFNETLRRIAPTESKKSPQPVSTGRGQVGGRGAV